MKSTKVKRPGVFINAIWQWSWHGRSLDGFTSALLSSRLRGSSVDHRAKVVTIDERREMNLGADRRPTVPASHPTPLRKRYQIKSLMYWRVRYGGVELS